MWSIADEDREFELQGGRVYFICFVSTVIVGHNDGVNALRFSPGSFYYLMLLTELYIPLQMAVDCVRVVGTEY